MVKTLKNRSQALRQFALNKRLLFAQRGYLMVSLMIVLFVTGALLTLYAERQAERSRLERGEQLGYALSVMGAGFDLYLNKYYIELAANQPQVPGITNALQPTAKDLIREVNIRGVAPAPPLITGASYEFLVSYPQNCTAPQKLSDPSCRPVGLVYIDRPMERGSNVDYVALGRAARVMKGRGGYSRPESPSYFTFPDSVTEPATIQISNPASVAGILAWRADTLVEDEERLKTNGGNRMNDTLRLNGMGGDHDVEGAKNITASGWLQVLGSGLWSTGLNVSGNSTIGGNQTVNNWLEVKNWGIRTTDLKASGSITSDGPLTVKGGRPGFTWGLTVDKDALISGDFSVSGDARINGVTKTDYVNFSRRQIPGRECKDRYSIGMSPGGNIMYCGYSKKWDYLENSDNRVYRYIVNSQGAWTDVFTPRPHSLCIVVDGGSVRRAYTERFSNGRWRLKFWGGGWGALFSCIGNDRKAFEEHLW